MPDTAMKEIVEHRRENDGHQHANDESAPVTESLPEQIWERPEHHADDAVVSDEMVAHDALLSKIVMSILASLVMLARASE